MTDFSCFTHDQGGGRMALYLQVDGMRCTACAFKIESALNGEAGVQARINYSTQRLRLSWDSHIAGDMANSLARKIEALGFSVAPFDLSKKATTEKADETVLLRCLAVAGFATTYVMLFSDALWFSSSTELHGPTRDLIHWCMALVALPTLIYSGRPFYLSAARALRHGRTNMDVPISIAIILTGAMSVFETIAHGPYVYFDASVMLIFFLLIGRFLDLKARAKSRAAAQNLLAMLEGTATIIENNQTRSLKICDLLPGMILKIATGEKIAADCQVLDGLSEIDTSLITGETLPVLVGPSDPLHAGTLNLSAPLTARVAAASKDSLLSQVIALMEAAESAQARYVRIADRAARIYAPLVHVLAIATFLGWRFVAQGPWEDALMKAMAVLIVTCPCALGLAVPVAQVLSMGQLFKTGVLIKSGKALETLATIDTVIFDKTGTLTLGRPEWTNPSDMSPVDQIACAALASYSRHPLAQAIAARIDLPKPEFRDVEDRPGCGLSGTLGDIRYRLGSAAWLGVPSLGDDQSEVWFEKAGLAPLRLTFNDPLRFDAGQTLKGLRDRGIKTMILSGDRETVVKSVAKALFIDEAHAGLSPVSKLRVIETLRSQGHQVLMVGDGLNDAAALSAANVSMAPATGMDITQTSADIVFRGDGLGPVLEAYDLARGTDRIIRQNLILSFGYNLVAVPLAALGFVTPLIAAIAMSGSSLVVIANAFRLKVGWMWQGGKDKQVKP